LTQLNFDATQVAPAQGNMGPVPSGWYYFLIEKVEVKPTRSGGTGVSLILSVVDENAYKGRKVFPFINFIHPTNEQAQNIGRAELSALCVATDIAYLQDSSQLVNKIILGKVKIENSDNPQYPDPKNRITAYKHVNEAANIPELANGGTQQNTAPTQSATQAGMPPPINPTVPQVADTPTPTPVPQVAPQPQTPPIAAGNPVAQPQVPMGNPAQVQPPQVVNPADVPTQQPAPQPAVAPNTAQGVVQPANPAAPNPPQVGATQPWGQPTASQPATTQPPTQPAQQPWVNPPTGDAPQNPNTLPWGQTPQQ